MELAIADSELNHFLKPESAVTYGLNNFLITVLSFSFILLLEYIHSIIIRISMV